MEINPLVTVNILSYNRRDELRNTLTKVYEQDYKNIEVIVVDNASSDGSPEMVKSEFPSVKLLRLEKNIGIAGWNEGFRVAQGECILVLDDDSYPGKETIRMGVSELKDETFRIVAFNIINLRFNYSETEDFKNMNPYQFTGCGALINKNVLELIGYYDYNFFIYLNELDYCIRVYNAKLKIIYLDDVKIFHVQSPISRNNSEQNPYLSRYRYFHNFIGWYIILIKHFSFKYYFVYSFKWILNRFIICLKYPYIITFLHALIIILIKTPKLLRLRKKIQLDVQKYYNYGNMPLIDRWYFPNFKKDNK